MPCKYEESTGWPKHWEARGRRLKIGTRAGKLGGGESHKCRDSGVIYYNNLQPSLLTLFVGSRWGTLEMAIT